MNSIENFRSALRLHLGEEQYRVLLSQWSRRSASWHEEALAQFFEVHPEHRLADDQLEKALRICEVHGIDLQPGKAEVIAGCLDYALEYLEDRDRQFPHACLDPISSDDADDIDASIWYCPECRSVQMQHEKWKPN